jgi:hypothetical protein
LSPFAQGKLGPGRRWSRSSPAGFEKNISILFLKLAFYIPSVLTSLIELTEGYFYSKTLSCFLPLPFWLPTQSAASSSAWVLNQIL